MEIRSSPRWKSLAGGISRRVVRGGQLDASRVTFLRSTDLPSLSILETYTLYPSTLPRTRPTVSSTSIASTSLIAEPEASLVEPPRARLRRLRYEMEELEEQLKQEALEGKDIASNEGTGAVASEGMLRQLQGLRVGLSKLEASKTDGSGAVQEGWEGRLKRLRTPAAASAPVRAEESASPSSDSSDDRKAAELDRRLAALEQTIGVGSVTGDSVSPSLSLSLSLFTSSPLTSSSFPGRPPLGPAPPDRTKA